MKPGQDVEITRPLSSGHIMRRTEQQIRGLVPCGFGEAD